MPLRQSRVAVIRAAVASLTLAVALVTVGLTAPADGLFTIRIRPVFLRLGISVDLKVGSMHVHGSWSAVAEPASTNSEADWF